MLAMVTVILAIAHISGADKCYNLSICDTSVKIGMSCLCGSLDKKIFQDIWNFKLKAIFQNGQHFRWAVK